MSGPQAQLIPALILRPQSERAPRIARSILLSGGTVPSSRWNHTSAFEPTERHSCKAGKVKVWRVMS
jgi:hypothetical protein